MPQGVRDDWPEVERVGCAVEMAPGDVLFAREDVWHRTQDLDLDRVQLKLEVLRLPMEWDYSRNAKTGRIDFHVGSSAAKGAQAPDAKAF